MVRLKSVDLKICFDTSYTQTPLGITYNHKTYNLNKGKTFVDCTVESVNHLVEIGFFGFDPNDNTQAISVQIYYKDKKLDVTSLCTFYMEDNQYEEDKVLQNYNDVFFNGRLQMQFFQSWFECNLLEGANITNQKRFLHKWVIDYENHHSLRSEEDQNYDIFCIGCSFTYGDGLDNIQDTWPELLSKQLDRSVANFGVVGMSIHGCYRQALYCLENLDVKKMIVLLPPFGRMLHRFKFLGNNAYYNYTPVSGKSNLDFFNRKTNNTKIIKHSERFGKRFINRLVKLNQPGCRIYLSSWDADVYDSIPMGDHKLPKYPDLKIYTDRASDGKHPHYKHNKFFVESIHDIIDKI